jgi:hypothetical protein
MPYMFISQIASEPFGPSGWSRNLIEKNAVVRMASDSLEWLRTPSDCPRIASEVPSDGVGKMG